MNNPHHRFIVSILLCAFFLFCNLGCFQTISNSSNQAQSDPNVRVLKVGISPNAPPMAYKEGGKLQGLEVDFGQQLSKHLGMKVRFIEIAWSKQVATLEEGKIDIIMSGMTVTPKRAYRVTFAKPYMRSGQIILVRSNQAQKFSSGIFSVMGKRPTIGTVENTTGDSFITKTISRPKLTRYSNSKRGVQALVDGDIDVFVHDAPIICHYAALSEGNITPILQMATEEYLAWAINKTDVELLKQVNAFIDINAQNGELATTLKRWIPYL